MGPFPRAVAFLLAYLCLCACDRQPVAPQPIAQSGTPLEGTVWTAMEIGGEALATGQRAPTLTIDAANNRASGDAGCNQYGGTATRGPDGGIVFKDVISTLRACPSIDTETRFLKALTEVTAYRISRATLELLDASGAVRLKFRASGA